MTPNADVLRIFVRASIASKGIAERLFDVPAMILVLHVDEVVDDHAAQVAQPQLPADLLGRLKIHLIGGLFGVVVRPEVAAVHVDRHQRLGLLDDDRAAHGQRDLLFVDPGDFLLDLVAMEKRFGVGVVLDAVGVARHDDLQELRCLRERVLLVHPDGVDIAR